MPRPLQPADPPRVGPFRLNARLHESAAGIVYLGADPYGVHVSVALLTKGAAGDAAARDRFRAAIVAEMPAATGVPQRPPLWTAGATTPLVAAHPTGETPWAAAVHDPSRPGAERFLEPVMIGATPAGGAAASGEDGGEAGEAGKDAPASPGPRFEPYWIEARDPAALAPASPRRSWLAERGLIAAILTLALLLLLLALALAMLFACEPVRQPTPTPSPTPVPSTSTPSPSPTPSPTPSTPSPSPSGTTRSPSPSGTGSGGPV